MPDKFQIKVIIGLGNPGEKFKLTRHNIGFLVLDELSKRWSVKFQKRFPVSDYTKAVASKIFDNQVIYLIKPLTFVNLSGVAVKKFVDKYSIKHNETLVICDDFSLPFGRLRLRQKGSSGGHKGLQSIIENLGSNEFLRLRIGIGPITAGMQAEDFVLSEFSSDEKIKLKEIIDFAVSSIEKIFQLGIQKAMEIVNRKNPEL